jgi:hypothetical protein
MRGAAEQVKAESRAQEYVAHAFLWFGHPLVPLFDSCLQFLSCIWNDVWGFLAWYNGKT